MQEEIKKILKTGYAIDNEEKENGVRCLAAPIFDRNGENMAGISVSGATQPLPIKRLPELGEVVKGKAQQISIELGYNYNL
jgi:DNA-binding IclR family transcriptional regulator